MKNVLTFLLLFFVSCNAQALKQEDLLHPDEAFQLSALPIDGSSIRLTWEIAEGYYLYRTRLSLSSEVEGITLNNDTIAYPKGDIKDDPNLGEVEVYQQSFSVDVPLERHSTTQNETALTLKAKYQGCAEAGLCYPPQWKKLSLTLPQLATSGRTTRTITTSNPPSPNTQPTRSPEPLQEPLTAPTATPATPAGLSNITGKHVLTIDQALQFSMVATDKETVRARWTVMPNHHLYRNKISFSTNNPQHLRADKIQFPTGKMVNDEFFGEVEIYDQDVEVIIPLLNPGTDTLTIQTEYQGCSNDAGVCYPPVRKETTLSLAGLPERSTAQKTDANSGLLTDDYFSGSFAGILLAFFAIGLGLSLTPCIFPMIPILSGIIAGQSNLSVGKAFSLSLTYVIASASAYALIGLVFGYFGENLQSSLQHPIAIGLFATLFVVLALSMFGFFELQMPNRIQSRLNEISNNQRGGSLLGAAVMGFLSTLIVGPCVAPALAAALTYIADSKDAILGASALFSMGFGMGVILLIVGTLGGHLLPRAGAWMDVIKALFGIVLLGMAIWMLSRIAPTIVTMLLIGVLLVSSGVYMGALDKLHGEVSGWDRFWKSIGLVLLFLGFTQLFGVVTGSQNVMHPLKDALTFNISGAATNNSPAHKGLAFRRIKQVAELDTLLEQAAQSKQLVLLDFYADWCVDCIRMEKDVFATPEVIDDLSEVIVLQADVTKRDEHDKALEKRFGIIGPPIVFFDRQGQEIEGIRMIGYEDTTAFRKRLRQFNSN